MKVVFLHSGWRTGSTYLWTKFRNMPQTTAYYEPFHELLLSMNEQVLSMRPNSWSSHHPPSTIPYFAEYRPVIEDGAVKYFTGEFPYRTYFMECGDKNDGMVKYINNLIAAATADHKIPVFGFCRSLGRVGWLSTNFDSCNILLLRDPRQQWASIWEQKSNHKNNYFFIMHFLIIGQNRKHPLIAPLMNRYDIPLILTNSVIEDYNLYCKLYTDVAPEVGYFVFFYHYIITLFHSIRYIDIAIDIDRLSNDDSYRVSAADQIAANTSLRLTFDDARIADHSGLVMDIDFRKIEDDVFELLNDHPLAGQMISSLNERMRITGHRPVTMMHMYRLVMTRILQWAFIGSHEPMR